MTQVLDGTMSLILEFNPAYLPALENLYAGRDNPFDLALKDGPRPEYARDFGHVAARGIAAYLETTNMEIDLIGMGESGRDAFIERISQIVRLAAMHWFPEGDERLLI